MDRFYWESVSINTHLFALVYLSDKTCVISNAPKHLIEF